MKLVYGVLTLFKLEVIVLFADLHALFGVLPEILILTPQVLIQLYQLA